MRDKFIKTLCGLAARDPRVMLITGDLGFAVLDDYRRLFPSQYINAGIAEQNMTMVAVGMALEGWNVFTYSIGNFPTLRCLEMIRNDAAYHNANVKVVSVGGGFSYGALGISHHATEDIAIMRVIPNVTCLAPTGLWEVEQATVAIASMPGTCFLRLDKDRGATLPSETGFVVGVPRRIRGGEDVAFLVTGGVVSEVEQAAIELDKYGISASIYSVHSIKPMDSKALAEVARSHNAIVTVEEHSIYGGLAGAVLESLADVQCFPRKFLRIGLDGCFSSVVGSQQYLRSIYKMDAAAIVERTRAFLCVDPHG